MEQITYGAPRLVDWVAQIKAGAATVRVHFTGGALTSYGVTPAEYTTANPFIQKVIENSSYFKEGRIILLRKNKLADSPNIQSRKPKTRSASVPTEQSKTETSAAEVSVPTSGIVAEQEPAASEHAGDTEMENTEVSGLSEVAVNCLQDAQAYLQEHFNIASYKVRTYEAAQRAASEHGVRFMGGRFDSLNEQSETDSAVEV